MKQAFTLRTKRKLYAGVYHPFDPFFSNLFHHFCGVILNTFFNSKQLKIKARLFTF